LKSTLPRDYFLLIIINNMNSGVDVKSDQSSICTRPICLYGVLRENFTLLQRPETIQNYGSFWTEKLECIMALTAELKC
jgi:hypothetical protein